MSFYCSDNALELDDPGFADVAWHCMGEDVRIILPTNYVSAADARVLAAALLRCAEQVEVAAEFYGEDPTRGDDPPWAIPMPAPAADRARTTGGEGAS